MELKGLGFTVGTSLLNYLLFEGLRVILSTNHKGRSYPLVNFYEYNWQ